MDKVNEDNLKQTVPDPGVVTGLMTSKAQEGIQVVFDMDCIQKERRSGGGVEYVEMRIHMIEIWSTGIE